MRLLPLILAATACQTSTEAPAPAPAPVVTVEPAQVVQEVTVTPAQRAMFGTLSPAAPKIASVSPEAHTAQIALGQTLYHDGRLSVSGEISCNSCHRLDQFGQDGEPTSPGHDGTRGARNSPTVLNASIHVAQFWDGRAADVEEQAKGPILNPIEMGMPDEATVVATLSGIDGYAPLFAAAFPDAEDPITYDNMANAIGAFERTLVTPSRFDDYLAGDASALTAEERAGFDLYMSTGCTACHSGPGMGGSQYMKMGLVTPYETADVGRMEVTGLESDKHVFKVPSLRNIAETGPYFHDGSIVELKEVVILMANHQLGKTLTNEEADSIVAFLHTLTGELPEGAATVPEMPT